jgi:von Willebrand factor type A domain
LALVALSALVWSCSASGGDDALPVWAGEGAAPSAPSPSGGGGGGGASGTGGQLGGLPAGGSSNGPCASDADCSGNYLCNDATHQCEPTTDCGKSEFTIAQVAPNMMILLDRSGSMTNAAGGDSRWNVAKKAIQHVTTGFDDKIRFGLATYSSCLSGGCSAGSIIVPIGDKAASSINGFLATTVDQGSSNGQAKTGSGKIKYLCDSGDPETSTGKSLAALAGEPTLQDPTRPNAVILLTDGAESCSGGCVGPCGAQKLLSQSLSVKTYVIGLGVNGSKIDTIAAAGGTTKSISANNQSDLDQAFDQIAASVVGCDFLLGTTPPDPNELHVYFNNDPTGIANDANDGWTYDPNTNEITFNGSACSELQAGKVSDIDVVYGCPGPTVD